MALTFDDTQAGQLLVLLGLPEDTDDTQLVIDTVADVTRDPLVTKPSDVAAAAKSQGLDVIDADSLTALRNDAAEGRKLVAAAAQAKVAASVDDAIGKGKITPARREHWVNLIGADPGMADVLASVPAETAVPLTELGHSTEATEEREWFY
jgi:hypothetical protein